jgi:metal-responsive CopG/Arc/MetJ family transcriptional regulator
MKTAVSIPDKIFSAAEKTARRLGIRRSQLFARALEEFIRNHGKETVTKELDAVYQDTDEVDSDILSVSLDKLRRVTRNDTW